MEEIVFAINDLTKVIKGNVPAWVTVIGSFTPILLTIITIYLSIRMDKNNRELQESIHKRDIRNQARHDLLEIYDVFTETVVILKKRGTVAGIFSQEYSANSWNQELYELSIKLPKAYDRSKLLIEDNDLSDYLLKIVEKYNEIYSAISRYIYSGVPTQMLYNARNSLQSQNPGTPLLSIMDNVAIRNQLIQMCENDITKEIQQHIDDYCKMFDSDKFDVKFRKHLLIDELSSIQK